MSAEARKLSEEDKHQRPPCISPVMLLSYYIYIDVLGSFRLKYKIDIATYERLI